jgi:hypothetical protein
MPGIQNVQKQGFEGLEITVAFVTRNHKFGEQ